MGGKHDIVWLLPIMVGTMRLERRDSIGNSVVGFSCNDYYYTAGHWKIPRAYVSLKFNISNPLSSVYVLLDVFSFFFFD